MLGFNTSARRRKKDRTGESDAGDRQPLQNYETRTRPHQSLCFDKSIAFEITDEAVSMAAARRMGRRIRLIDVRKVYFPGQASAPEEKAALVTDAISEFCEEHHNAHSHVSLSVSGSETAFRSFLMPRLGRRELDSAVHFEVKKQLPFPVQDCLFDYRQIGRITQDDKPQVRIALHAGTRRMIEERLAPFRQLDIDVNHVYSSHDAIGLLLRSLPDFRYDRNYALFNIERDHSQIAYYLGDNLEFYNYCSLGSSFLSRRTDDKRFEDFAELLAEEVQNSLDFYTGQVSTHFTNRIYVYGDLAYADELVALLSTHLGFEFTRFPAEKLSSVTTRNADHLYSVPACLPVVAASTCSVRLANLIPRERLTQLRRKTVNRLTAVGLIILAAIFAGSWLSITAQQKTARDYLDSQTADIASFMNSNIYDSYSMVKRQIAADRAYLDLIAEKSSHLGLNLKELSNLTPTGVKLSLLDFSGDQQGDNMHLHGVVNSGKVPPEVALAEFVETLNASPFYDNVQVARYRKVPITGGFELEFNLTMRGLI